MDGSSHKKGYRPWQKEGVDAAAQPENERTRQELNTSHDPAVRKKTTKATPRVGIDRSDTELTKISAPETSICPTMGPIKQTLFELQIVSEYDWEQAAALVVPPVTDIAVVEQLGKTRASWVLDPNQYQPALTKYQIGEILGGRAYALRFQNHVLLDLLGEGGMGKVFKARNVNLSRIEAIKTIRPDQIAGTEGTSARQRFEREAHILATLNHPNITTIYYSGYEKDMAYIAMEYVSGVDMETEVRNARKEGESIPMWWAVQRIIAVAEALAHAHEHDVIHRDIKPGNIMNTGSGLKVLDMGIARLAHPESEGPGLATLTQGQTGIGTPAYMPPEQWADARHVEPASDIYSLGCTLFYILAGDTPYHAETLHRWMYEHVHTAPPAISSLRPEIPKGLDAVIQKMLAKLPEDRYQSCREVIEALRPYADENPVLPRRSWTHAAWPVLAGMAAVFAVAAIGATGWKLFLNRSPTGVEEARQLVQESPDSPQAHLLLAQSLASAGQHDEAASEFNKVLELDAGNVSALHGRGQAKLELGQVDEALQDLLLGLKSASGPVQEQLQETARAAYVQKAKKLAESPDELIALYEQASQSGLADEDFSKLAADALVKKAEASLADRQWERAAELSDRLLDSNAELSKVANRSAAFLVRGQARAQLRQTDQAISDLIEAVKQNSKNARFTAEFCLQQASANIDGGSENRVDAMKWLDASLEFDSKLFVALKKRGQLHFEAGDHENARQDFDRALALQDDAQTREMRGRVHLHFDDVQKAADDFRVAAKLARNPSVVRESAAKLLADAGSQKLRQGQTAAVIQQLELAIEFDGSLADDLAPQLLDATQQIAQRQAKENKLVEAIASWERAFALAERVPNADVGTIRSNLSATLLKHASQVNEQGYFNKSLELLDRAIGLGEATAELHAERANAREKAGQWKAAAEDYLQAMQLAPLPKRSEFQKDAADALLQWADQQLESKEFEQALSALEEAKPLVGDADMTLRTLREKALHMRAANRIANNHFAEALPDFEELSQSNKKLYAAEYGTALVQAGNQAARRGDSQQARTYYERAKQISQAPTVLSELADGYRLLNDTKMSQQLALQAEMAAKGHNVAAVEDADKALQAKQYPKAVELFQQVVQQTTSVPDEVKQKLAQALLELGKQQLEAGNYDEALTNFTEAGQYSERLPGLEQQLAKTYLSKGAQAHKSRDFVEAIAHYNQAMKFVSDNPPAYFNRALSNAALGKWDQAVEDYKTAAQAYKDSGNQDEAEESLQQAARLVDRQAAAANEGGDYKLALQLLDQSRTLAEPTAAYRREYVRALTLRGEEALNNKDFDKAIADFETARQQDAPKEEKLWRLLGDAWLNKDNPDKAYEAYREGKQLFPNSQQFSEGSGKALSLTAKKQQSVSEAVSYYQQAAAEDPPNAATYRAEMGSLYAEKGDSDYKQSRFAEAIKAYQQAAKLDPQNAKMYEQKQVPVLRRQALELANDPARTDDAVRLLEQAAEFSDGPIEAEICEQAAKLCVKRAEEVQKSDLDEAHEYIDKAIKLDPHNRTSYDERKSKLYNIAGIIHYTNGNIEAARDQFTKAINLNTTFEATYRQNRAMVFNQLAVKAKGADERVKLLVKSIEDCSRWIELDANYKSYLARATTRFDLLFPLMQKVELSSAESAVIKEHRGVLKDFEKVIELEPRFAANYLKLAYLLVAWPDHDLRNGKRAVELATKACQLQGWNDWESIQTLAAAYAEAGEFNKAIQRVDQAMEMAPNEVEKENLRKLRKLYEGGSALP